VKRIVKKVVLMSIIRRFKKEISVSLILTILVTMYFGAVFERKPNISLVVLNSTNVLDVHEPVKDLSILFRGEDIQKKNLNLRIITVKVENDGGIDILQTHYDMNDKWGVKITSGEIVEVRVVESNSKYIKSDLKPKLVKDEGLIELEKIIFDRGKYFVIEILVLHEKQTIPTILPFGKIAGIEEMEVSEMVGGSEKASFVKEVLSGSPLVHATRLFSYFLLFWGIVGLIILSRFGILGLYKSGIKSSRRKEFRKFLKEIGDPVMLQYPKQLEVLSAIFEIAGNNSVEKTKYFIEDISRITGYRLYLVEMHRKQARTVEELARQKSLDDADEAYRPIARKELLIENDIIVQLVRNEIVTEEEDENLVVDNEFKELLDKFIEYSKK